MSAWFDIGVNLTDPRLSDCKIIEQAFAANVEYMAATGTDIEGSQHAAELAATYPNKVFATAGVHPHYAKDVSDDYLEQIRRLSLKQEVVAIGECGLDFNRNFSPKEAQLRVFEQQLELASELKLPVFLHERDAYSEQIALLRKYRSRLVGGVAHCFTGNEEQMKGYLDLELYIGVTGWLCDDKRGKDLQKAVSRLPLERVVLETDAPYLMPKTLKTKSRTNVPANLPHVAQHVAAVMGIDIEILMQAAMDNSLTLFQLKSVGEKRVKKQ